MVVGSAAWMGVMGESGRDGVDTDPPARGGGDISTRMASSAVGRSSLDILICCLTAVSRSCPRCDCSYDLWVSNRVQSTIEHNSEPTSRSET